MIHIKVKLVGLFKIDRFKEESRQYPTGSVVQRVVDDLQLPPQHFGIVLINGVHATSETVLNDGDQLTLLPVFDGG